MKILTPKLSLQTWHRALSLLTLSVVFTACSSTANHGGILADRASLSDQAIEAEHRAYEAQQAQIKLLNDSGKHPVASYSMAKAQCWLDVSYHEYTRNDRSPFPRLALEESRKITGFLATSSVANAVDNPANQTPLINQATQLRPDLWESMKALKTHAGASCAAQKLACAEVELVHAGNEFSQLQWRHAKPYLQIAEDLLVQAQREAQACPAAQQVVMVQPAPAPVQVAATPAVQAAPALPAPIARVEPPVVRPSVQMTSLSTNLLFSFDGRDWSQIRPYTRERLEQLVAQVKAGLTISKVRLIGHADRLNASGDVGYNSKLSQDRVEAVRQYLISQGVAADRIQSEFKADAQPIEACTKPKFRNASELQECLLPNRRVEVMIEATQTLAGK